MAIIATMRELRKARQGAFCRARSPMQKYLTRPIQLLAT